jgi:hypothetical protein
MFDYTDADNSKLSVFTQGRSSCSKKCLLSLERMGLGSAPSSRIHQGRGEECVKGKRNSRTHQPGINKKKKKGTPSEEASPMNVIHLTLSDS